MYIVHNCTKCNVLDTYYETLWCSKLGWFYIYNTGRYCPKSFWWHVWCISVWNWIRNQEYRNAEKFNLIIIMYWVQINALYYYLCLTQLFFKAYSNDRRNIFLCPFYVFSVRNTQWNDEVIPQNSVMLVYCYY